MKYRSHFLFSSHFSILSDWKNVILKFRRSVLVNMSILQIIGLKFIEILFKSLQKFIFILLWYILASSFHRLFLQIFRNDVWRIHWVSIELTTFFLKYFHFRIKDVILRWQDICFLFVMDSFLYFPVLCIHYFKFLILKIKRLR